MVYSRARRLLLAAMMGWAALSAGAALAQSARPADQTAISAETKAVRSRLEAFKSDLDRTELALEGRYLPDAELQGVRHRTEPVAETIRTLIDELNPKLDASRARLAELGPKPKAGEPE